MVAAGSSTVLGVSGDFHDAAAALLVDGVLVAAAAEERFSRVKHDASFPSAAIRSCLDAAGLNGHDVDLVAFYEKPFSKLERIVSTHARRGPTSVGRLRRSVGSYLNERLWTGSRSAQALGLDRPPAVAYAEHHVSHAAAAFYPSPFDRAAVLTVDGVGEATTASFGRGAGHQLELLAELQYPASLGLFYAALTEFCGFEVNDGESKLMGLAPYGQPRYVAVLREHVIHVADDGAVRLDPRWFAFESGRNMTAAAMAELLDGPRREIDGALGQREADIAASAQAILELSLLRMARHVRDVTGEDRLCLAGGVALNCVANRSLIESGIFEDIWIQPAPGDDGGAVGAAMWAWHDLLGNPRPAPTEDGMSGAALGPSFAADDIAAWLSENHVAFRQVTDRAELSYQVATALADGRTVGWFQGRMEFGPRALGHRSILADPRDARTIERLNQSVKRRESFRPFAPAVLPGLAAEWFEVDQPSPYMLRTADLRPAHRLQRDGSVTSTSDGPLSDRLLEQRSAVAACTHVDHSARLQTISPQHHPELFALVTAFEQLTGCPMVVNTSFNRRDEPIVCTPADAYRCFIDTDLDLLVLEDCLVDRRQPTDGAPQ